MKAANRAHIHRLAVGAVVLLVGGLLPACALFGRPAPKPPDTRRFEEGDVVLTFGGATRSWICALNSSADPDRVRKPVSHAEVLIAGKDGRWLLAGVSGSEVTTRPLEDALPGFRRMIVFRSRRPAEDRARLAAKLRAWMADPNIRKAKFDYAMRDVPGRRDRFYCLGFINEVYREAGLPPPFPTEPRERTRLGDHFAEILGFRPERIKAPDGLSRNPDFERVLTWEPPVEDRDADRVNEIAARAFVAFYQDGWRLRLPETVDLGLAVAGLFTDPPEFAAVARRAEGQTRLFTRRVMEAWRRMERRGRTEGLTEAEKRRLVWDICLAYRDRFFVRGPHARVRERPPAAVAP